jgi:hypothetical protein
MGEQNKNLILYDGLKLEYVIVSAWVPIHYDYTKTYKQIIQRLYQIAIIRKRINPKIYYIFRGVFIIQFFT